MQGRDRNFDRPLFDFEIKKAETDLDVFHLFVSLRVKQVANENSEQPISFTEIFSIIDLRYAFKKFE